MFIFYEVTSYRDKETGKVRQRSEYKGKEIIKDNIATLRKPRNRITARKVLDSAPYIIYRFAEDFGIQDSFISALGGLTNIPGGSEKDSDPGSRIHDGFIWFHQS